MPEPPFRFYQITDRRLTGDRLPDVLQQLAAAGLRGLQIREKDLSDGEFLKLVDDILLHLGSSVSVLVNGRADVALARGLGIHRPESGAAVSELRRRLGSEALIGVSCHDLEGCLRAQREDADFVVLGPVFTTPGKGAPMGLDAFGGITSRVRIPVFALGGVTPERAADCLEAGAFGVAAISATLAAPDPAAVLRRFLAVVGDG